MDTELSKEQLSFISKLIVFIDEYPHISGNKEIPPQYKHASKYPLFVIKSTLELLVDRKCANSKTRNTLNDIRRLYIDTLTLKND